MTGPSALSPSPEARFLATMSHELRTPLNLVIGFSETLMQDTAAVLSREEMRDYAGAINEAGRQLLAVVDLILDVVQIGASDLDLPADLIDIAHLVAGAMAAAIPDAAAGELTLCETVASKLPLLRGDEKRLRSALAQMIGNAIKFTPSGGAISLVAELDPASGDLVLTVVDTGIGIDGGDLERAFEPFVQLDASLARRFPGSGLGLYAGRMVARAHGGDLVLQSVAGAGTTAVLRLPPSRLVPPPSHLLP